jgi:NADP-dependent 3-hydroxy acid dehydrogenase YdfG
MKTAIITGASKGVGFATSKIFAENGYRVIAASRNIRGLKNLKSKNIDIYPLDLTNFNEIKIFAKEYEGITLDVLINNAGGGRSPTEIINESPENFNYAYSLNVSGPMYLSKLFTPNMQKSSNATIMFVSSLGGRFPYVGGGNYTNAKRGISGLVDTMRLEYPHYGVKITEVCPGSIDTVEGEQRSDALSAEDMAKTMFWIAELPKHVNINYLELNHLHSRK